METDIEKLNNDDVDFESDFYNSDDEDIIYRELLDRTSESSFDEEVIDLNVSGIIYKKDIF